MYMKRAMMGRGFEDEIILCGDMHVGCAFLEIGGGEPCMRTGEKQVLGGG